MGREYDAQRSSNAVPHCLLRIHLPAVSRRLTEYIFPRMYARMYYAHPRARVMSFSPRRSLT